MRAIKIRYVFLEKQQNVHFDGNSGKTEILTGDKNTKLQGNARVTNETGFCLSVQCFSRSNLKQNVLTLFFPFVSPGAAIGTNNPLKYFVLCPILHCIHASCTRSPQGQLQILYWTVILDFSYPMSGNGGLLGLNQYIDDNGHQFTINRWLATHKQLDDMLILFS